MASASTEFSDNPRLGGYLLVRRIAVGGMAEVFEARREDEGASERVVLKLLLPQFAKDKKFISMLEHEAHLNAHLAHPNLVRVFGLDVESAPPYIVMEYVDGVSLSELLEHLREQERRLPGPVACALTLELLRALEHVHTAADDQGHALGIVHRDVTPQNILLSRDGRVRLGDFGIARSNMRDTRTRTGVIKGKLRYLAPEQVTGSAIDARTDLYAAGLILFELVTAEPYIRGETEIELLRVAEAPEPRVPSVVCEVDNRLDKVVERAVRRFPEERFPNAETFRRALETVEAELGWGATADHLALLVAEVATDRPDAPEIAADSVRSDPTVLQGRGARGAHGARDLPDDRGTETQRRRFRGTWIGASVVVVFLIAVVGLSRWRQSRPDVTPAEPAALASDTSAHIDESFDSSLSEPTSKISASPDPEASVAPTALKAASVREPALRAPSTTTASKADAPRVDTPSEVGSEESDRVSQRLKAIRGGLSRRGILISDLSRSQRSALRKVESDLAAGRVTEATSALGPLEQQLAAVRVDAAFVRAKLDRVSAAIRAAGPNAKNKARLDELKAAALQDYMAARYEATNGKLNKILSLLAAR